MTDQRPVSRERDAIIPADWQEFFDASDIPAAIRHGDTLRLTGHTGDVDGVFDINAEAQIRQTFRNMSATLAAAGAAWSDVVELTSYHVGYRQQAEALLTVAAEFLDPPFPAWSGVGVTELFEPEALVEISCVAILPAGPT